MVDSFLTHRHDFDSILEHYSPSEELLQELQTLRLGVIAGTAGGGKDTIRELLLRHFDNQYYSLISDTTRQPRNGERNGHHYFFKQEDEVLNGLRHGDYLQAAVVHGQQVSGIHRNALLSPQAGKIALAILVVTTEAQIFALKPDVKTVFLVPPDYQTYVERMHHRRIPIVEMQRRLASTKAELEFALNTERYYCITTVHSSLTMGYVDAFFRMGEREESVDGEARETIRSILHAMKLA